MDLNASHTLGCAGRNNSKPSCGSSVHSGGTKSGQTSKKPKDLSAERLKAKTEGSTQKL